MKVRVDQVRAVAVRAGVFPTVPFDAAPVIGRTVDGQLLELARFTPGFVEGTELSHDALAACVGGGDATWLPQELPVEPGVIAWVFGAAGDADSVEVELGRVGAWHKRIECGAGAFLLVRRPECDHVRTGLHQGHRDAARHALVQYRPAEALRHATWAWLLARPVAPIDVAALVRAHELAGDAPRGAALRAMERNSHGTAFEAAVAIALEDLPLNRLRALRHQSLSLQEASLSPDAAAA